MIATHDCKLKHFNKVYYTSFIRMAQGYKFLYMGCNKDKRAVIHASEDWLIFENTHEAIVDKETWELAQKLRKTPRRHDTIGEANPLTGLLYCAD